MLPASNYVCSLISGLAGRSCCSALVITEDCELLSTRYSVAINRRRPSDVPQTQKAWDRMLKANPTVAPILEMFHETTLIQPTHPTNRLSVLNDTRGVNSDELVAVLRERQLNDFRKQIGFGRGVMDAVIILPDVMQSAKSSPEGLSLVGESQLWRDILTPSGCFCLAKCAQPRLLTPVGEKLQRTFNDVVHQATSMSRDIEAANASSGFRFVESYIRSSQFTFHSQQLSGFLLSLFPDKTYRHDSTTSGCMRARPTSIDRFSRQLFAEYGSGTLFQVELDHFVTVASNEPLVSSGLVASTTTLQ